MKINTPTKFSTYNHLIPIQKFKSSRFSISTRGPTIWYKHFAMIKQKILPLFPYFKNLIENWAVGCYPRDNGHATH